jgi:adenylosuccinate lyase
MIAGTMGRFAEEIRVLGRPEFGEVSEAWQYGKVGSSTMPHKRNPERCEQAVVLAKLAAGQAGMMFNGIMGDHERDSRTLRVEWSCVPDVSHFTLGACAIALEIADGLTVHPDRLLANVREVAEHIASERLMLALGKHLGKQTAHERVYELTQEAQEDGVSVRQLLLDRTDLHGLLDDKAIDRIFDPNGYLGESAILTQRTVARARKALG